MVQLPCIAVGTLKHHKDLKVSITKAASYNEANPEQTSLNLCPPLPPPPPVSLPASQNNALPVSSHAGSSVKLLTLDNTQVLTLRPE